MKKTAVILLSVFMLSILMSVMVNAIDITTAQNFNNLTAGANITTADNAALQLQIYPKTNTITVADFPSAADKSLKFHKTGTDDPYVNCAFATPVTGLIIMDIKVCIEELNTGANIMFREPSPIFFNVVSFKPNGDIVSNAKNIAADEPNNVIGKWKAKEWMQVVVKVDPSAKKYSVIINGKTLVDNAAIEFDKYDSVGMTRFAIDSDKEGASGNALIYVDDIRTYTGSTEVMSDSYFGVSTFVPPADPVAPKPTTPSTTTPATADPITLAFVAAAVPVVGFAVKKTKKSGK